MCGNVSCRQTQGLFLQLFCKVRVQVLPGGFRDGGKKIQLEGTFRVWIAFPEVL